MRNPKRGKVFGSFMAVVVAVLVLSVSFSCASSEEPASTPIPAAPAAPPAAPTALAPTPLPIFLSSPTAIAVVATPTRVLPTPTPLVTGKPVYGGTLRYAHNLDIDTLDPIFNALAGGYSAFYLFYDGLFRTEADGKVSPGLAQSWEYSADGKTITVNLQKGVKFHDGTVLDAQAVKWNIDRMLDPVQVSPRRGELQPYLDQVAVLNENTLRLQLRVPFRPLLAQLGSDRMGYLVSPAAVDKFGGGRDGAYSKNPVGTGPFRFVVWTPGERLLVTRNENYWDKGKPYLDAIVMQGVTEPSSRLAMLRTGETDLIYGIGVTGSDIPVIERSPGLKLLRREDGSTYILQINPTKPPFDNKALRQALAYAVDREGFVQVVLSGVGKPAYTFYAGGWAANFDLKPIVFDIAKAKAKLVEAGYPGQATIPIACRSSEIYIRICEVMQASFSRAGINLKIDIRPAVSYSDRTQPSGFFQNPGFGSVLTSQRADPHTGLYDFAHSKGRNNPNGYKNTEVDSLIDEASTIYDVAKAKPIYDRVQSIIAEDAALIFLGYEPGLLAMSKRVQGIVPYFLSDRFEFAWLER